MSKAPAFQWEDPLLLGQQLSEAERMVRDAAAAYAQGKLAPRVLDAFEKSIPIRRSSARWGNSVCSAR